MLACRRLRQRVMAARPMVHAQMDDESASALSSRPALLTLVMLGMSDSLDC